METNWNQLIERYLNNELSAEEKAAFETELQGNPELKKEFELHQLTKELIQRNSLRTLVNQSGKWFHLKKILLNSGIALVIAGALAAAVYFVAAGNESNKKETPELMEKSMIENLEKYLAFENIDPEYFKFTGESDVFLSESGVLLSITDESFLLNGKPYAGEAIVQWQEAQKASDIVKAGLSTKSGDKLLETQGMFSLNAFTPEGKKLKLTDQGVYVQVPVDELKKDMKLFTGVPGKNGTIDWQNPKELERLPKPKNMANMDLFPPKYEPKLNALKWFKEKAKRDSLYLSFEEEETSALDTVSSIEQLINFSSPKEKLQPVYKMAEMDGAAQISMMVLGKQKNSMAGNLPQDNGGVEYPEDKAHWSFDLQLLGNNEALVIATVNIEKNWEINAFNLPKGSFGVATNLRLEENSNFKLLGLPSEPKPILFHDKEVDEDLAYHVGRVQFKQKIKLVNTKPFVINGSYSYQTCKLNSYCLPPFEGTFSLGVNGKSVSKNHIPPSKVLAIWNKKFNNTNLATQDFEDRMKAIHETCDEKVFDVYAKNLSTPLWELDQRAVKMGYPQFQRFADQKVGAIQINDAHQKNLDAFYEKAIETLREKGKKEVEAALKKERQWDNEIQDERSKEVLRRGLRESANLNEEYGFNLQNVYRQLGKEVVAFKFSGGTAGSSSSIVNIDKYVWDATIARQSTVITDPETGKTAQITYEPLSLEVKESGKYDKLYLYLFSKEINSYQRLDFKNGKLDYNLNGDMNYRAFVVGMNDKGYFYYQINELKAEDLGMISLDGISEKEFEKRINILNKHRTDKPMSLKDELKWLFKEKANYAVQKKRRENAAFRREIRPTIYSCGEEDHTVTIVDDIKMK